jgi:hypothetical protein
MNRFPGKQQGASAIAMIITLVIVGYGAYIGLQYVPQVIESRSIDSILSNIETSQKSDPVSSVDDAKTRVIKMLQINEMDDMTDGFTVKQRDATITIKFSYDRNLNLGYKTKQIHYEKSVSLD